MNVHAGCLNFEVQSDLGAGQALKRFKNYAYIHVTKCTEPKLSCRGYGNTDRRRRSTPGLNIGHSQHTHGVQQFDTDLQKCSVQHQPQKQGWALLFLLLFLLQLLLCLLLLLLLLGLLQRVLLLFLT